MRFIFIFFLSLSLYTQNVDFNDPYDYNLRNLKSQEGISEERYREYTLPPNLPKPPLISPKNVQRQPDLSSLLQGGTRVRQTVNQQQNQNQVNPTNNLPFNPVTGQFNPEAILQQREKQKLDKERRNNFLHREKEQYTETRGRRMEVIFSTTFPFAAAISVGLAFLVGGGDPRFVRSTPGFLLVMSSATALSFVNVWIDINYYDEYMRKKEENKINTSNHSLPEREFRFVFAEKKF